MARPEYGSVQSFIRKQWSHLSCNGFNRVQPHQADAAAADLPLPSTRMTLLPSKGMATMHTHTSPFVFGVDISVK